MTNFLEMTTIKTSFASGLAIFSSLNAKYSDNLVSVSLSINTSNILTYSKDFLCFLWPCLTRAKNAKSTNIEKSYIESFCVKDACIKSASTESANTADLNTKIACIKAFCGKVTCIKNANVGGTYSQSVYISNTSIKRTYAKSTYIGDAYIDSAIVIKYLGIYLQSFQISKVNLFGTKLKIGVKAG